MGATGDHFIALPTSSDGDVLLNPDHVIDVTTLANGTLKIRLVTGRSLSVRASEAANVRAALAALRRRASRT